MKKHIVSFSGGKDSTAMLLRMMELGMEIDEIVFADTGMEFPQIYEHIEKVEKNIGRKITVVKSEKDYMYYMFDHIKTRGKNKGKKGYMWMDWWNRWCTSQLKQKPIRDYFKQFESKGIEIIEYHVIALDESERTNKNKDNTRLIKYPLIDWGWTEQDALNYCYENGYTWRGLYEHFNRLSCYLCPLQRLGELEKIYKYFPEQWKHMRELDRKNIQMFGRQFRPDYSIRDLEEKFKQQ